MVKAGSLAVLILGSALAACGVEVAIPGWDGAPLEVSVRERYLEKTGNRTVSVLDASKDGTWAPSKVATSCVKKVDGDIAYVKIGGDPKRIGIDHGVKPAAPVAVTPDASCSLEIVTRVARGDDTFIVYLRAFDAEGRDVTASVPAPAGWSYSIYSKSYVKYAIPLAVCGKWTTLKMPFLVPEGVVKIMPAVCAWRGNGADVRNVRLVEGAVSGSREIRFDATARDGGAMRFKSSTGALSLSVSSSDGGNGVVEFEAEICDLSVPPKPRALDLTVRLPATLAGWTWHSNWRKDCVIAADSRFDDAERVGGFPVTRYPFSAVSKDGAGFAFGTPLDEKAYENRIVSADGIESRTPVGLLARGAGIGTKARFRYLLLPFKGTWGFRSAAKAYYAHEGHKLPPARAGEKEGTWVWPIWPSKGPAEPDDFGHTFWEAPSSVEKNPGEIRRARELGIGVYPYTEVWGMRQYMATAADGSHPPLSERLAELEAWAAQTNSGKTWFDAPREESARACLNSMPVRPDGTHAYVEDHWDNWTTWWRTNPDPRLPKPNRCSICWDHTLAPRLDDIDGVYLDSVAYGFSANFRNVRPEHLAVFDEPLVYDLETFRPCTDGMQHMTVFIDWLAGKLHQKGKRIFANTFGIAHRFNATTIDIFGCEVGTWGVHLPEGSLHSVITDASACEQRFFACRRPISNLLQEGHWERICPEVSRRGIEMYIENQMFYGFYPAVSTIGGEKKIGYKGWVRYFDARKRYERDRDLFKVAIPVIRRLNRAGWNPETLLRSNVGQVWIERYGEPGAAGECLFTVRNASDKMVDAELSSEFPVSALTPVWRGSTAAPAGKNKFAIRLDPWQTAVFKAD